MKKTFEELIEEEYNERNKIDTSSYMTDIIKPDLTVNYDVELEYNDVDDEEFVDGMIDDDDINIENIPVETLQTVIFNFTLNDETILRALDSYNIYCNNILKDDSPIRNVVSRLGMMLVFTNTTKILTLLNTIMLKSNLNINYRLDIGYTLCNNLNENNYITDDYKESWENIIYHNYHLLCQDIVHHPNLMFNQKIEAFVFLSNLGKIYYEKSKKYFILLFNDNSVKCKLRYMSLINLEFKISPEFVLDIIENFIFSGNNIKYRLLAAQYTLLYSTCYNLKNKIQDFVLSVAEHYNVEKIKSDATDILLTFGNESYKAKAKALIVLLGTNNMSALNIYEDKQNAHNEEVERSCGDTITFLKTIPLLKISENETLTLDYIKNKLLLVMKNMCLKSEYKEYSVSVKDAINRIRLDNIIYMGIKLEEILLRLYSYISTHEHCHELTIRLIQELNDMSGWCTKGHIVRLINVLSGFDQHMIRIDYQNEIKASLIARLNNRIYLQPSEIRDQLIYEMSLPTDDYEHRKEYLNFFRTNFSQIREELYLEYKDLISDEHFDYCIKRSVEVYDGFDF